MTSVFDCGVSIHLIDKVSGALATIAKQFTSTQTAATALQKKLDKIHGTFNSGLVMVAGGAALAAPLVLATKSAMELESALARVKIQTGASDAQMKMLNKTFTQTSAATGIFSKPMIASFASEMYSSGIQDVNQINALLPVFAKAADVTKLMSKGKIGAEDTLHTLVALAHQFGKYDPKAMQPIAEAAVAMSLNLPGGMKSLGATGSTVNVPGNRLLGIDPIELMAFQAAVAQTSGSKGAGGKGRMSASNQINALMRAMPGTFGAGLLSGKSGFAAAVMGLGDGYGASTVMKDGKLDFMTFQKKLAAFERMSTTEIAKRMMKNIDMLGKKAGDELPLVQRAISTGGKGVSKAQLMAQLMQYQFGSAGTVAMLIGDDKFIQVQKKMTEKARQAQKEGGIEKMQAMVMKTLDPQLQRLATNLNTLSSTIGMQLIPVITPVITKLGDFVEKLNAFAEAHPRIVKAGAGLIAAASAALIFAGSVQILRAAFMALQFAFSPLKGAIIKLGVLFTGAGGLTGMMTRLGVAARFCGPWGIALAVTLAAVGVAVANWDKIMKFVHQNHRFFIKIAAMAVTAGDKLGQALQSLVKFLGMAAGAIGSFLSGVGASLAKMPVVGAVGTGLLNTGSALGRLGSTMLKNIFNVDDVSAKRNEKVLQDHSLGGLVNSLKGPQRPINQVNHLTMVQQDGHDHEKCAATVVKKLGKGLNRAANASSGNSVSRSNAHGGMTRP